MKKKIVLSVFALMGMLLVFKSCKKEEEKDIEKQLYDMARTTEGFIWYKNSSELLPRSSGSGHLQPFLRTRFNTVAAAHLDATGKVAEGTVFAEGSVVVKELYGDSTTLERYAIMYKKPGHTYADNKGWVWGYIDTDGKVAQATSNTDGCTSCHAQSGNIDYVLMNKFFP